MARRLNQTALFRATGFYCKALPAISNHSYAVVLNTNLGRDNPRQLAALSHTVSAIAAKHAHTQDIPSIYVLGHHPQVSRLSIDTTCSTELTIQLLLRSW